MESARELLTQGKLDEAREQIDKVLARETRSIEALLLRSTLRTRQGESGPALADAEAAVRLSNGSAESQLRRAISLWRLQQYGRAKCVARWLDDSQASTMWKSMISARPEPEEPVEAIPKEDAGAGEAGSSAPDVQQPVAQQPVARPPAVSQAPRVDWYQSGNIVHITLYRKGLQKSSTDVRIGENGLAVTSSDFEWTLTLGHRILADESSHELTPYKVDFALRKAENVRWGSLESTANDSVQTPVAAGLTPQTSYSKWEHIDAGDEDEQKSSDPNAFFQELYKSSTPEVQRAMMKSFVESNGTALSTNWDEVKKGKVETQPPKDMEAREWH